MKRLALIYVIGLGMTSSAWALTPAEEARADHLNHEIRCVACQGQSIADSDADIAKDMRREIKAQIAAGKSDEAIRQELLDRYGDYVLFRPRFTLSNLLLWLLPPLLAVLGGAVWFFSSKKPAKSEEDGLSEAESQALKVILEHYSQK